MPEEEPFYFDRFKRLAFEEFRNRRRFPLGSSNRKQLRYIVGIHISTYRVEVERKRLGLRPYLQVLAL